eukprot:CAMPEP_0176116224 /NCGR_PEP_ID=MMETSP0120_2-20121206/58373_1 /TAXON_ID=160619 /ORGANISM="Kryptoperidinium foliaceum, Strain CCMP 1326" /LENGTH=137 /DNA_ID=CAMNT_0017450479 /DNA_START=88 /DNA_END=497 /DNA_ORIENTATION=+
MSSRQHYHHDDEEEDVFEDALMDMQEQDVENNHPKHSSSHPHPQQQHQSGHHRRDPTESTANSSFSSSCFSVEDIQSQDVKLGNFPLHPGNVTLQRIVASYAKAYLKTSKRDKRLRIYQHVRSEVETTTSPAPRFMV